MSESDQHAQLIARSQAGDESAFQALVHQYLPVIYGYAMKMTGNATEATDISQEVFVRFWEKQRSYNSKKASLSTWLHQIAHNLCIDHFRRHAKLEMLNGQDEASGKSLEQDFESVQLQTELRLAIQSLPERQRNALVLCHYQSLSNRQTAEIMSISVDALESLLSRARRALKAALKGDAK